MSETGVCAKCGGALAADDAFCGNCGAPAGCPECGGRLAELGRYCHDCGAELDHGLELALAVVEEPRAYCPHCNQPRRLARRYRYCPLDGNPIHLYVDVNELSLYMQGVRTQTEFRIVPMCEGVTLHAFQVFLGETPLSPGLHDIGPGIVLSDISGPVQIDRLVHPAEAGPGVDEPCPPGDAMLFMKVQYETGGMLYELTGRYGITVLPRDADAPTVNNYIGDRVEQSGDGPKSGGAHSTTVNMDFRGIGGETRAAIYIKEVKEKQGLNYKPARLHVQNISPVEQEPPRPKAPVPDWAPVNRARFFFHDGRLAHNYCVLSAWRDDLGAYGPVRIGRDPEWRDIHLREVERYYAEKVNSLQDGSPSRVSRRHWEFGLLHDPKKPELIQFTHVKHGGHPKRHQALIARGRALPEGQSCPQAIGDSVILKATDGAGELVGLYYAANAPAPERLTEWRKAAQGLLDRMSPRPPKLPEWNADIGGYAITRLLSLTGQPLPGQENWNTLEAYVLMPGWATIGSSRHACIVLPDPEVAGIHAYVLHLDGYYFIVPRDESTPVYVDNQPVPPGEPWPLKPDRTNLRIGTTLVQFDEFFQIVRR